MEQASTARADFERAKNGLKNSWYSKNVMAVLGGVREVVTELQQGGFEVSLDVRMTGTEKPPFAKADLKLDGSVFELHVIRDPNGYSQFAVDLRVEGASLGTFGANSEKQESINSMKQGLRYALLEAHAIAETYRDFSVNTGEKQVLKSLPKPRLNT